MTSWIPVANLFYVPLFDWLMLSLTVNIQRSFSAFLKPLLQIAYNQVSQYGSIAIAQYNIWLKNGLKISNFTR